MFKNHKKELEKLGYKVYNSTITTQKGDVVASVDPYGQLDTKEAQISEVLSRPVKKVRARTKKGEFIADDPKTPEVNEAWTTKVVSKVKKKKKK